MLPNVSYRAGFFWIRHDHARARAGVHRGTASARQALPRCWRDHSPPPRQPRPTRSRRARPVGRTAHSRAATMTHVRLAARGMSKPMRSHPRERGSADTVRAARARSGGASTAVWRAIAARTPLRRAPLGPSAAPTRAAPSTLTTRPPPRPRRPPRPAARRRAGSRRCRSRWAPRRPPGAPSATRNNPPRQPTIRRPPWEGSEPRSPEPPAMSLAPLPDATTVPVAPENIVPARSCTSDRATAAGGGSWPSAASAWPTSCTPPAVAARPNEGEARWNRMQRAGSPAKRREIWKGIRRTWRTFIADGSLQHVVHGHAAIGRVRHQLVVVSVEHGHGLDCRSGGELVHAARAACAGPADGFPQLGQNSAISKEQSRRQRSLGDHTRP